MLRKILLPILIWLGVAAAVAAAPPAYEGRKLYQSYCLLCHGTDGGGDGPLAQSLEITPSSLVATVPARSDAALGRIITGRGAQTIADDGRHELLSAAMPEWKYVFEPKQVDALVAYLRFLSRNRHELRGDPEVGAGLYATYCQACHGADGGGDGIMAALIEIEPMEHSDPAATAELDNERLIASILDGKGRHMPAWRGVLRRVDAEALVSYIRLLGY